MANAIRTIKTKNLATRILLHLLFWVLIVTYFAWGFGFAGNLKSSLLNALFYLPGHMIMMYSLLYFLTPRYLIKKRYWQFFAGLVIVVCICAGYAALANLTLVVNKRMFSGVSLDTGRNILPFIHVAGIAFSIKFLNYWHLQKQQTAEAQSEKLSTELELLKSQIHPHFLFNTLNNLYAHTLDNSGKAPQIVLKLSNLLRFMIYESKASLIRLDNEILLLQHYIELEQLRYGQRLDVSVVVSGATAGKEIAPLLLLPFVENAFKHGTSKQLDQCWISFDLNVEDNNLKFTLVNSVDEDSQNLHAVGGLGLQNVQRRLSLLYPGKHKLTVHADKEVFIVNLQLQLVSNPVPTQPSVVQSINKKYDLEMPYR